MWRASQDRYCKISLLFFLLYPFYNRWLGFSQKCYPWVCCLSYGVSTSHLLPFPTGPEYHKRRFRREQLGRRLIHPIHCPTTPVSANKDLNTIKEKTKKKDTNEWARQATNECRRGARWEKNSLWTSSSLRKAADHGDAVDTGHPLSRVDSYATCNDVYNIMYSNVKSNWNKRQRHCRCYKYANSIGDKLVYICV